MDADEPKQCDREKVALLINACDLAAKHYDDCYKSFVALDGKAQNVATVSGLVLAATAAFLNDGRISVLAHRSSGWLFLILAPSTSALAAAIFSLFGAKIRDVVRPFSALDGITEASNLAQLDCDQFTPEHVQNYYKSQLKRWDACLNGSENIPGIEHSIEVKARRVLCGQRLMILALLLLTILFGVVVVV